MMSKLPNFYLSEDEFKLIVGDGGWKINEIPLTLAGEIRGHFGIDTSYCVMASITMLSIMLLLFRFLSRVRFHAMERAALATKSATTFAISDSVG